MCVYPRWRTAENTAKTLRFAVDTWLIDSERSGQCPSVADLVASGVLDVGASIAADPWGNNLVIQCPSDDVIVTSLGPDGQFGTDDDIQIPKR